MRPSIRRIAALAALAVAGVAAWGLWSGRIVVPPHLDPWAPLALADTPNLLTGFKLTRLADGPPAACLAWLDGAGVRHQPIADRTGADGCGWQGATRLSAVGGVRLSTSAPLACPVVVALALWERHALQPAAQARLGSPVVAIDHLGSYACRDVAGSAAGRRSEHARANALDVAGFRLADGRRISVLRDWQADAEAESRPAPALFLLDAGKGACPFFAAVLGPAYNAAHRDHFHLDRGRYRICR
ncbi:extensin [Xylophilus sp. Kf1]|nr:extensin [Xylophilus sp. Kf1]